MVTHGLTILGETQVELVMERKYDCIFPDLVTKLTPGFTHLQIVVADGVRSKGQILEADRHRKLGIQMCRQAPRFLHICLLVHGLDLEDIGQ